MNTHDKTYNGWTNYATWRVNLEMFDGFDADGMKVTSEECKDYATEVIEMDCDKGFALDYALAFISDVNWHEISEAINELIEE